MAQDLVLAGKPLEAAVFLCPGPAMLVALCCCVAIPGILEFGVYPEGGPNESLRALV